jgi:glutamate synthase (NADPH/NADH) small chain
VAQVELFPEPPTERTSDNPWPQWPLVFRTSSSQQEGGDRQFGLMTKHLEGDGKLERLVAVEVELDGGQLKERAGSERVLEVDLLILAMGFVGPDAAQLSDQLGVELDGRGNVATAGGYAASVQGVFAAGDARRGQSLIVWAITEGREAAREIDSHLRGEASALPARGRDEPFGGR